MSAAEAVHDSAHDTAHDTAHDETHGETHEQHHHHDDYDPEKGFHPSCVTDLHKPTFDEEWQRRAFGLAVALSEFGHYPWEEFQQQLIGAIGSWQDAPADDRGRWEYYEHWVRALTTVVADTGILEDGYVMPEDREDGVKHAR